MIPQSQSASRANWIQPRHLALALPVLFSVGVVAPAATAQLSNLLPPERFPVLIHVSNDPFGGFATRLVTVYSDGLASLATIGVFPECVPPGTDPVATWRGPSATLLPSAVALEGPIRLAFCDSFETVFVGADTVKELSLDLRELGIERIRGPQGTLALPGGVRTVTYFSPSRGGRHGLFRATTRSNTFTYVAATGKIGPIEQRIENFLIDHVF